MILQEKVFRQFLLVHVKIVSSIGVGRFFGNHFIFLPMRYAQFYDF